MLQCAPLFQSTYALMPNNPAIDTTVLITILGLIAAVWAVVPASTRLRFRLGMSWVDWCVAIGIFLVVHYLVFEAFFRSVGLYYSFGPWKWGLDKGSSVYLLLVGLGFYILFRARKPKLANGKVGVFEALANTLLLTKRYDELFTLIEPHIFKLFKLTKHRPVLMKWLDKISFKPIASTFHWDDGNPVVQSEHENIIYTRYRSVLAKLKSSSYLQNHLADQARDLVKSLLNHPQFVAYLGVYHPHFCLKILGIPEVVREDFTDLFVTSLIADNNSLLYSELKNNENLNGRYRLALPSSNRILYFLFKDVTVAQNLALYQPIGESVCRCIVEDRMLADAYNLPLGYYDESGKYKCPIYAGIKLFEIMIHEAIHQGIQDHLWLSYYRFFTDKILNQLRDQQPNDTNSEWPTPFHYLICKIVTIASNWIDECIEVDVSLISEEVQKERGFDSQYIPQKAVSTLAAIVQMILISPKIDDRFKGHVLGICLERFKRFHGKKIAGKISQKFISLMIVGDGYVKDSYKQELNRIYQMLDPALKFDIGDFDKALKQSLNV